MKKIYVFIVIVVIAVLASIGIFINRQDQEKTKSSHNDPEEITVTTVLPEEEVSDEQNEEIKESAAVNESEAKKVAQEALEGYEIVDIEHRTSTGEQYYLITMEKNNEVTHVYVDSQTGEILYQERR